MQVNNIRANQPNFQAVKISDGVRQYPRLLEAVIDSPAIKKYIAENEANNKNTNIFIQRTVDFFSNRTEVFRVCNDDHMITSSTEGLLHLKLDNKPDIINRIINKIKFLDTKEKLPDKLKAFDEWVASLTEKK
ncbi:MAG: hypothetical protein NC191_10480 [Muribaculaceae bacterium]|nr:hypothetical protein [Muribaculaceae bacterium]